MSKLLKVFWANGEIEVAIQLSSEEWQSVTDGQKLIKNGAGYIYDEEFFQDRWCFNSYPNASLVVEYGQDGGEGFVGNIEDSEY